MSARLARIASCRSGAGAVEFALCLPVLVLLVMGLFELGWTQHCLSSVRFSLESAGRHLQLNPDASEAAIRAIVMSHLEDLAGDDVAVTLSREASGPTGQMGVITAVYERDVGIPGMATMPIRHTLSVETPISNF
ncbi:TadE/TadG family type IV pilus assembly protein [Brevundimonas sp.]|uniref:TadE/TadG family type IV pilus assembly protein n=1 Tax=Brevundimonas sp. TaxID=1871086 RepID=UPI0025EBDFD2|nr:TadE/TadG family type IV pilus assembly protein [Brevundimonas sp.]